MEEKEVRKKPWWQSGWLVLLTGLLALFLGYLSVGLIINSTPAWKAEDLKANLNTIIYDREGQTIAVLHGPEDRLPLDGDVPRVVKDAFVAVEDVRFYRHKGVDLEGIFRAMITNLREGRIAEGGSTITQQLVKNSLLTPEKTYERKIKEMLLAIDLEKKYSKEEILDMYLTRIYFGEGAYGLEAAARTYFNKPAKDLSIAEAALLAGLLRGPTKYSPFLHPEAARERMETVISLMEENQFITPAMAEQAKSEGYSLVQTKTKQDYQFPYFVDYVIAEAGKRLGISEKEIYGGGLRIYTSLDRKTQQAAESVWADARNFPAPARDGKPVQGAVALLDYHTGEIKGLVGGRGYDARRGFSRATDSRRQPGSTFKPLAVYGPALEEQYPPYMVLNDAPVSFGKYVPKNYGGGFKGNITMSTAIKFSVNIWAVKMLDLLGVEKGWEFAKKLGFDLTESDKVLPLALGGLTKGVSPLQMASGYGAFANSGVLEEPHAITQVTDSTGRVWFNGQVQSSRVMKLQTAAVMTELLTGVVQGGTGTRARMNRPVAGKTGTTQLPDTKEFAGIGGNKDAWFVGYTPQIVGAVWIGFDRPDREHYLQGVVGGSYPAMLWKKVMEKALAGIPPGKFSEFKGRREYRHDIRTWGSLTPEEQGLQNGKTAPLAPGAADSSQSGAPGTEGEAGTTGQPGEAAETGADTSSNQNSPSPDGSEGQLNDGAATPGNDAGAASEQVPGGIGTGAVGTPAGGNTGGEQPRAAGTH